MPTAYGVYEVTAALAGATSAEVGRALLEHAASGLGARDAGVALVRDGSLHVIAVGDPPDAGGVLAPAAAPAGIERVETSDGIAIAQDFGSARTIGAVAMRFPPGASSPTTTSPSSESVAGQAAQALERARLYEREHRIATTLQQSVVPTLPDLGRFVVAGRYVPGSAGLDVGGDWYDVFSSPEAGSALPSAMSSEKALVPPP